MMQEPRIRRSKWRAGAAWLPALAFLAASCGSPPPQDPYCSSAPLPGEATVKSGQGALQVDGTTSAYFYVHDAAGKSVNHQALGRSLALDPGKYQVKVNYSAHAVTVEKGKLTKCSTGTLLASGTTQEYWYLHDPAGKSLQHERLGKAMSLVPGTFRVKVNNSETAAEVTLNQVTEIRTGTLLVRGATSEYYYATDTQGRALNHNMLEKPLALLPGTYSVKLNNAATRADIAAGQVTELKTGTLLVKGLTEEYYYVIDSTGTALNHQGINKPLSFLPGSYRVRVNQSEKPVEVAAAQTAELQTGSLTVEGAGADYYYVTDKAGTSLNHQSVNKALSFFPGEYNVKAGQNSRVASVEAGQATRVKF